MVLTPSEHITSRVTRMAFTPLRYVKTTGALNVMQQGEMAIRQEVIDQVRLLSLASEQLAYEKSVPHANVVSELFCGFCDDLFHPKSAEWVSQFTEDELKGLAHLYGVLSEAASSDAVTVSELLKDPRWRRVIAVAKDVYTGLKASA